MSGLVSTSTSTSTLSAWTEELIQRGQRYGELGVSVSLVRPDASSSMGEALVGVAGGGRPSPLLLAVLLALVVAPCAGLW